MAIEFRCHHCDTKLRAKDEQAGRNAKCKHCHNEILIPRPLGTPHVTEPPVVPPAVIASETSDNPLAFLHQLGTSQKPASKIAAAGSPMGLPRAARHEVAGAFGCLCVACSLGILFFIRHDADPFNPLKSLIDGGAGYTLALLTLPILFLLGSCYSLIAIVRNGSIAGVLGTLLAAVDVAVFVLY
jgi:DNA-directed RNA polymerase subunit RPC12/RpoP